MTHTTPTTRFVPALAAAVLGAALALPCPASAGLTEAFGPNSDFPDSNMVMPFSARDSRVSFFQISNLGVSGPDDAPVPVTWEFYDASGELVVSVERYILGEGGTDIVDVTAVRSKDAEGNEGPPTNLEGRNGFVVVSKVDGEPDLVGTWTIANVSTNAGFGGNAAGLGFVGILEVGNFVFGTSFAPTSLGDNLLMILGIDDFGTVPTSLTEGNPPPAEPPTLTVRISLHSNDAPSGVIGEVDVSLAASAMFTRLEDLFPGFDLNSSVTIVVSPLTESASILGFYGQAVGQFGAGQSMRTDLPLQ